MIYILTTTIFLIIEIISYISLAKGEHISINRGVFFAIGIKNILFDISGIPFLIGSCAVKEENIK